MTDQTTRSELLAELAEYIAELTEVRHHAEVYETETLTAKGTRKLTRKRHITTLPSLIRALQDAVQPSQTGDAVTAGGFESRPSADLGPIQALQFITGDVAGWAKDLGMPRAALTATLTHLVGVGHTDSQLRRLVIAAGRWVKSAQYATGWLPEPQTLNQPCPLCYRPNALRMSMDEDSIPVHTKCTYCGVEWTETQLGLLGQMLTANQTVETMTMATCDDMYGQSRCYRREGHGGEHNDSTGRHWPNECGAVLFGEPCYLLADHRGEHCTKAGTYWLEAAS